MLSSAPPEGSKDAPKSGSWDHLGLHFGKGLAPFGHHVWPYFIMWCVGLLEYIFVKVAITDFCILGLCFGWILHHVGSMFWQGLGACWDHVLQLLWIVFHPMLVRAQQWHFKETLTDKGQQADRQRCTQTYWHQHVICVVHRLRPQVNQYMYTELKLVLGRCVSMLLITCYMIGILYW